MEGFPLEVEWLLRTSQDLSPSLSMRYVRRGLGVCVWGWMCVSVWVCVFGGEMTWSFSSAVSISGVTVVSHQNKARIFSSPCGYS